MSLGFWSRCVQRMLLLPLAATPSRRSKVGATSGAAAGLLRRSCRGWAACGPAGQGSVGAGAAGRQSGGCIRHTCVWMQACVMQAPLAPAAHLHHLDACSGKVMHSVMARRMASTARRQPKTSPEPLAGTPPTLDNLLEVGAGKGGVAVADDMQQAGRVDEEERRLCMAPPRGEKSK